MDIKVYKNRMVTLKIKRMKEAINKLKYIKEKGVKLSPILEKTVEAFKVNMRADFMARQTPDSPPMRWVSLSKKYAQWKFKKYGKRVANLIQTGRLKLAVDGGSGWYQIINNKRAVFGISGIPYAAVHQYGNKNIPARRYFLAKGNKLPTAVIEYMIGRIEQTFNEVKDVVR